MNMTSLKPVYQKKRVLLTGHTGFKGTWLSVILSVFGADVYGYSLVPEQGALYSIVQADRLLHSETGDIRDIAHLKSFFQTVRPEYVFHLAAQPLVRESYRNPRETYETNVMGTVNVCECIRETDSVRSFVNVTTDKVYLNREWDRGYREDDPLDGYDPYSNSKSCSDLVTHSYDVSFLRDQSVAVSTARAGNVIGGGDYATDRILPDCVRAALTGKRIVLRNPGSVRPFQHVLEPLFAYLLIAARQEQDKGLSGSYNVGPDDADCVTVAQVADLFCEAWGVGAGWEAQSDGGPHEAKLLRLDCGLLKQKMGWKPCWSIREAIGKSVEWYRMHDEATKRGEPADQIADCMSVLMKKQIESYVKVFDGSVEMA